MENTSYSQQPITQNQNYSSSEKPRRGIWNRFAYAMTTGYAKFNGRATRADFLSFFLVSNIIVFIFCFVSGCFIYTSGEPNPEPLAQGFRTLIILVFAIPNISLDCRRLHDMNISGWWLLSYFLIIPIFIILAMCIFVPSNQGTNKYGRPCA